MIGWLIKLMASVKLRIDEIYCLLARTSVMAVFPMRIIRLSVTQLISNCHYRRSCTLSSRIPIFQRAVMPNREVTSAAVEGQLNARALLHCVLPALSN